MEQVFSLYNMLAGKVNEEVPGLDLVAMIFDTPSWHRCRHGATSYLKKHFGESAGSTCDIINSSNRFEASMSLMYPHPIVAGTPATRTTVFQVNLDQAAQQKGDTVTLAKGILAHETAHAISHYKRNGYDYWQLYEEEALADIFACAVMANQREPHYLNRLLEYRLCSADRPGQLAITSTEHSFPALADEAAPLIAAYGQRPAGALSVAGLKQDAQKLVRQHGRAVREWRCFANAAMDLTKEGYGAGEVLALARSAGSPFVKTVEAFTEFRAASRPPILSRNPFDYEEGFSPRKRIERGASPKKEYRMAHAKRWFGYTVLHNQNIVAAERRSI